MHYRFFGLSKTKFLLIVRILKKHANDLPDLKYKIIRDKYLISNLNITS
jgi:hypothetical protein